MKIENNGMQPVSPNKRTDSVSSTKKNSTTGETRSVLAGKDRAEVTESARLLAKARVELESSPEVENARVEALRGQVERGEYEIPYEDLARRLLPRLGRPVHGAE